MDRVERWDGLEASLRDGGHVAFPPKSRYLMLPPRPARAARAGLALYEAVEPQQRVAVAAARLLAAAGMMHRLPSNDRPEIDWAWWSSFVRDVVEPVAGPVAKVAFRVPGNPRVSLLAMRADGRPVAFAKLLNAPQPAFAAAAGTALTSVPTASFTVPLTLAEGDYEEKLYRVTRPLPEGPHRSPPLEAWRIAAIADEFHGRLAGLPREHGVPADHVVCHADLTPRNLRVASDGGWWLFDWDNVRWGPRLADELRYWSAWMAYRGRADVARDAPRIVALLRQRGTDAEIAEAVQWPDQLRQTYRPVELELHAAVMAAVAGAAT